MASLQELLSRSVTQNLGLSDILAKREREAVQAGQSLISIAGTQAQATLGAAQSRAQGIVGAAQAQPGGAIGSISRGFQSGQQIKQAQDKQDLLRKKTEADTQLTQAKTLSLLNKASGSGLTTDNTTNRSFTDKLGQAISVVEDDLTGRILSKNGEPVGQDTEAQREARKGVFKSRSQPFDTFKLKKEFADEMARDLATFKLVLTKDKKKFDEQVKDIEETEDVVEQSKITAGLFLNAKETLDSLPSGTFGGTKIAADRFLSRTFGTKNANSKLAAKYAAIKSELSGYARSLGEKGALAEGDIKRVAEGFPTYWMSKTEQEGQFEEIQRKLNSRILQNSEKNKIKNPERFFIDFGIGERNFKTSEEAEKANLPLGARVFINGREAIIY